MLHKNVPPSDNHVSYSFSVADIAARNALVVTSADVGKIALVLNDGGERSLHALTNEVGPIWSRLSNVAATAAVVTSGTVQSIVIAGGVYTVAANTSDYANIPLTGAGSLAISGAANGRHLFIRIQQHATAAVALSFPTSFRWESGVAGVISTALNAVDLLVLTTFDGGATFHATLSKGRAAAVIADSLFSSVGLLLHMEGTEGSIVFTDSSSFAKTVTPSGATAITNVVAKYNAGSARFNGTGNLNVPSGAELDFAAGDLTVELWVRHDNILNSDAEVLFCKKVSDAGTAWVQIYKEPSAGRYVVTASYNGTSNAFAFTSASVITSNVFSHVALTRSGSTWTIWIDGANAGSVISSGVVELSPANPLKIGSNTSGANPVVGYMDEFRITKGIARYTAPFTPPIAPFPSN